MQLYGLLSVTVWKNRNSVLRQMKYFFLHFELLFGCGGRDLPFIHLYMHTIRIYITMNRQMTKKESEKKAKQLSNIPIQSMGVCVSGEAFMCSTKNRLKNYIFFVFLFL